MSKLSFRLTVVALAALAALLVGVGSAVAQAPKFHSTSSSVNNSGALVVSFDERGLGGGDVNYVLTADVQVTYACFNRGGKNPSAANKQTSETTVSAGGSFEVKNGRVQATLVAGPPGPSDFACPGGQRLVLADVSYTNIVLTDATNNVSTSVADASRVFVVV